MHISHTKVYCLQLIMIVVHAKYISTGGKYTSHHQIQNKRTGTEINSKTIFSLCQTAYLLKKRERVIILFNYYMEGFLFLLSFDYHHHISVRRLTVQQYTFTIQQNKKNTLLTFAFPFIYICFYHWSELCLLKPTTSNYFFETKVFDFFQV